MDVLNAVMQAELARRLQEAQTENAALRDEVEILKWERDALARARAHLVAQQRLPAVSLHTACARVVGIHGVVRVCPEKDHECGEHAAGWCAACPKRLIG